MYSFICIMIMTVHFHISMIMQSDHVLEKQIIGSASSLNRTPILGLSPPGFFMSKPARSIEATALGLNAVASVPPE